MLSFSAAFDWNTQEMGRPHIDTGAGSGKGHHSLGHDPHTVTVYIELTTSGYLTRLCLGGKRLPSSNPRTVSWFSDPEV